MQISFGARIPVSRCNIFSNKDAQRLERATMYEIDCKDEDDFEYVNNVGNWDYKVSICGDISSKYESFKYPSLYTDEDKKYFEKNKFYSIENKNGEVLGLCETTFPEGCINIEYLESSPGRGYEYAGQNMVANVSRAALNSGKTAIVRNPAITARKFYTKICKFKEAKDSWTLVQPRENAEEFLREVEQKTHINYNA